MVGVTNKKAAFTDTAIPLTHNLQTTITDTTQISGLCAWNQAAVATE